MPRSALALRLSLAAGIVVMATLAASSVLPVNAATQAQSDKVYVPNRDGDFHPAHRRDRGEADLHGRRDAGKD